MIQEAAGLLANRKDLTAAQMTQAMEEIMSGKADTDGIVDFLSGLSAKGETAEELTAAVSVMRKYAVKINTAKEIVLDTCGTGGDVRGTFNISTAAAFVVSGCGITVAKHGNRSVSSKSGSADILEALGININMDTAQIERCLNEIGIAFLFAPNMHPAMKYAIPARKQIGKRTMFNILGPLTNPAGAKYQLVGVYADSLREKVARVLSNLGALHALVVHGQDGLDEITTATKTSVTQVKSSAISNYEVDPRDFGFKYARLEDLAGAGPDENAAILFDILKGVPGPKRDIVVLNAAAAIYTALKAPSIKEAVALAEHSIDSGAALKKLGLLKKYSHEP